MTLSLYGCPSAPIFGANPQSLTLTQPCQIGDALICNIQINTASPVVTDNVNAGNWTMVPGSGNFDAPSGFYYYWFYKVCNAVGTPTVTVTCSGAFTNAFDIIGITGFTGVPTIDTGNVNLQTGTGVTANTTQTANFSNEILLAAWAATSSFFLGSPTNGWAIWPNAFQWKVLDVGPVSSGTNCDTSNIANGSTYWIQSLVGVYDGTPTNTAIIAWV